MPIADSKASPLHAGQYVREKILAPKKMSVTAAAKLVGVGRPAFSNFLNGNVATTPEMAARIERAFNVPAQELLAMQATFDAAETKSKGAPAKATPYVPPFLQIKATDVEAWVSRNIAARSRLAAFLRTLVHSTASDLKKVDFPANDDAQRAGWDGFIEVAQGNQWIPDGLSGWEFGTDQVVKGKADSDFEKSVQATPKKEREQITFVFVTPRNWAGKANWIAEQKAKRKWKDVRAYDSCDLEQWMEQSIAAQTWFANETLRPSNGVRTLDKCWRDWADVASPSLDGVLFKSAVESAERTILSRLGKDPDGSTVIAADSTDEALAFLAQLFLQSEEEGIAKFKDRVLVFDEAGSLPKLAQGTKDFIAVAATREVERELGPLARTMHTFVVYPRNAANADPHVELEPLNYDAFRVGLEGMGYERDDISRYATESGHSLTVLRRRLSNVPVVRTPAWAADNKTAMSLIPFLMVGAWNSKNTTDQTALALLANVETYEPLEKEAQRLAALNDAPLWSLGTARGVISKIDLLFAIAGQITEHDLKRYFELARIVLGEDDPSLDLPESERWAASIHGKAREFSGALRQGVAETLVLFAVHGNQLFAARLGINCEHEAARLVRDLLTPLKTRILEANDRDLTAYAEAAPNEFLTIIEEDLKSPSPETYGLMRPAATEVFGSGCPRTGLLWALEGLAWSPDTLPRAALILAQLAQIEITDNWANKPIGSLESIFRSWMPQTAADHDTRLSVMKLLAEKFPSVAWKLCVDQFDLGHRTGHYSHKPSWRNDGHGFGEPFKTWGPILAFRAEMVAMALSWKGGHSREMLSDLVRTLHGLNPTDQAEVWKLINTWAATASDADKAAVREQIRVTVMSRRAARQSKGKSEFASLTTAAKAAYASLRPTDLLNKHEWLFREHWVDESADELHEENMDFRKRDERIANMRTEALREIYADRGLAGIYEFASMGKAASMIGWLMMERVLPEDQKLEFLIGAFPSGANSEDWNRRNLVHGGLRAIQNEGERTVLLKRAKKHLKEADFVRMLLLSPFRRSTWALVDKLAPQHRDSYWHDVGPDWIHESEEENIEAVERLLSARRPRAAFASIRFKLETLTPELLHRLMSEIVKEGDDQPGHYQPEQYYIEKAFQLLDKDTRLTLDQKASLEFAYIDALARPWAREGFGIPNLEKYVESHPEFFVQAVVWTYRRKGEGEDPPEYKVGPDNIQHFAERGHKLLEALKRIPGHDDLGELKADLLLSWVKNVRDACEKLGRLDIADQCIGKVLAGAPVGKDGVWPCEPVRQVMEEVHSKHIMRGAHTGLYNSRGVTWRGEGGAQERELADKYRTWASSLKVSYPYVSSHLLMDMVRTYEHEADREDTEAGIRRRLY
ncbi:MAG: HigA family addiction module antidote protein [Alphaproteobacteria bacterium]|nr:HigA family addiction module antidote protein [Alphaproteobacteria bacterium]